MRKKIIILSIILITSLSAKLLNKLPAQTKKEGTTNSLPETETSKKIKSFNVKYYWEEYEHKKKSQQMLNESIKRNINP